jgi:hypothetical protein
MQMFIYESKQKITFPICEKNISICSIAMLPFGLNYCWRKSKFWQTMSSKVSFLDILWNYRVPFSNNIWEKRFYFIESALASKTILPHPIQTVRLRKHFFSDYVFSDWKNKGCCISKFQSYFHELPFICQSIRNISWNSMFLIRFGKFHFFKKKHQCVLIIWKK